MNLCTAISTQSSRQSTSAVPKPVLVTQATAALRESYRSQGRLALPHSVAVDDCASALYVADLEGRAVRRFSTAGADAGKLTGSWDVTGYGKPYAVTPGPYGCALPHVLRLQEQ